MTEEVGCEGFDDDVIVARFKAIFERGVEGVTPHDCTPDGGLLLHRVVMSQDYGSLLTFMLEAGADPNKQCWTGDTAWDTAHETNNPDDNVDTLGILRRFAVEEIPHEDTDSDSD